jgi:uncharacterized protein YjhX (UPF0386 family)
MLYFKKLIINILRFCYKRNHLNFYVFGGETTKSLHKVKRLNNVLSPEFKDLVFCSAETKDVIVRELSKDSEVNVIVDGRGCVAHYSCVTTDGVSIGEIDVFFKLKRDQVYIYNCKTELLGRRQGLYRGALNEIITKNRGREVFICCLDWNVTSIECLESIGFNLMFSIKYLKVFGFKYYSSSNFDLSVDLIGV